MSRINRDYDVVVAKLSNVLANTPAIAFGQWAGAVLITPSGYVSTSVEVYTAASESDTFVALKDSSGNAVTFPVGASSAVVLPSTVYGCRFLKLKTSGDDTSRDISLCRKG